MADAIISTVVEDLNSMLKEEVKLVTGVSDEVHKLLSNLKSIHAVLDDAEERQLKEASVKNWLFNLKAVSYDMDDVIDEWKTSRLQHQHRSSGSDQNHLKHKVLSIFRCICFITRDVGLRHVVARKIREFQQRLDDIANDKDRYQFTSSPKTDKHIERSVTTSYIVTQEVKGRDEEKNEVKSMILNAKSELHIVSLVGMGGIGKTTLAKLVYNDSEIHTHFHKKIWVCISGSFDEMRIAKAILESIDGSSIHDLKELESVLAKIRVILEKKRFLLVLDEVWNENPTKWKELKQFLMCGSFGSTILITTRKKTVALMMGCTDESIYTVRFLNSEHCWSIISHNAQVQGDHQEFERIGRKIADKCKGLPLAAATVGGLLHFKKSEKEWLKVLEKKEWEGEDCLDSLKLSYYDLSLPLKQCFKYCAIFPKDSKISKRRLIEMWMAQGYLKTEEKDGDLEMIGETYLDNLIARSLLLVHNDSFCMLHDMVSDLAQAFTKNECLIIEVLKNIKLNGNSLHADADADANANANVRHLTLRIKNDVSFPRRIYDFTKLRSLIIQFDGYKVSLSVVEFKDIFDHLTCLRILDLSSCGIKKIPSSINRLVHLRWLDLSANRNLEQLPETLCECYNLQTLILNWCKELVELPKRIEKLIKLMHLYIEYCFKIKYLPKGIGNLQCLRELTVFFVSVNEGKSFSIVEMEKLNKLRGRLAIRGLGNVKKPEEARKAQLKKKENITELSLSFDRNDAGEDEEELPKALKPPSDMEILYTDEEETVDGDNGMKDKEEVLEALEPPSNLEILTIGKYRGKTLFPSWMMELNRLKKLTIYNSRNCEELPPLGKLMCLEELVLRDVRLKRVGVEFMGIEKEKDASTSFLSFPKLNTLKFEGCREWEEWDDIDEWLMERINNKTITIMPSLQVLTIYECRKLKTFPYRLMPLNLLKVLSIINCTKYEELPPLGKLPCLEELHLENIRVKRVGVEFMGIEKEKDASTSFPKLKILKFQSFWEWEEWDDIGEWLMERINNKTITIMPSLQQLFIKYSPKLKTLPYHLMSSWMMKPNLLRKLIIDNSGNCEELPPLGKLSCLEELYLRCMRVKRVGVEFMGIEKEKDTSTSFLSFPKLNTLTFEECREWEEWDDIDKKLMERINNKTITIMSSLQQLYIKNCTKLKKLPYCLLSSLITTKLQKLDIYCCEVLKVEEDKLSHIPHLAIRFVMPEEILRNISIKGETDDKGDSGSGGGDG